MRTKEWRLGWLPPVAAFVVFAFEARRYASKGLYFVDDPFISMRYAAHLVTGGELSFNAGDRVEGYSNLLHVLIHALAFEVRGAIPDAALAIEGAAKVVLAASLLEAALLGVLAGGGAPRGEEQTAWYYAWVLTMAGWPFAFWATAGMETPLEGLLYAGILLATSRLAGPAPPTGHEGGAPQGTRAPRDAGLLGAIGGMLVLVTLLRFEGVVVALAIAAALGWHLARAGRARAAMALAAPVVAASAAYHLWRVAYFGSVLPNTFVAKATGGSTLSRLQAGASYCGGWASLLGGGLGLLVIAMAIGRRATLRGVLARVLESPVVLVAGALVATKVALVVWGGGDWMPGWRMLVPVTPVALFLLVRALLALTGGEAGAPVGPAAIALAALLIVCGRGNGASFPPRSLLPDEAGGLKKIPRDYVAVGQLLERAFGGGAEEVAIGEAGLVPFEARDVRFMDLFGLVDRDMARQPGFMHNRVHAAHVLERAPAAVVFAHLQLLPPYGPYQYGQELLASRPFLDAYRLVDAGPELRDFGWALYVRRDLDPGAHGLRWAARDPRLPGDGP